MIGRVSLIFGASVVFSVAAAEMQPAAAPRIAIIIDDLGYQLEAGRRTINLPGPVACAILPATPRGRKLAETAFANGKEVLLHLPLESISANGHAEPGGILLDMSRAQLAQTFSESLESVPHAIGVNSHRGSLLTRHPGHMRWLMEEIVKRDRLIFIDSYTTHESIALQLAGQTGVPAAKRDVFLDSDRLPETVEREFRRLKELARKNGAAVGIGHPYPSTLAFLEREIPRLLDQGIELVSISELVLFEHEAMVGSLSEATR
ncbi:MAG: divergent polysaccharide deacetylase family protein [Woeseia sp.]